MRQTANLCRHALWALICPTLLFAAATALGSCATLEEHRVTGCGDSILDVGEDCDTRYSIEGGTCGAENTANACHYICTAEATCPEGWGCGLDGRCYRPSGQFLASAEQVSMPAEPLAVEDLDGDGVVDLIGQSGSRLIARFGDRTTPMVSGFTFNLPAAVNSIWVAPFDDDTINDIMVAFDSELLAFAGRANRVLEPQRFPTITLDPPFTVRGGSFVDTNNPRAGTVLLYVTGNQVRIGSQLCAEEPAIDLPPSISEDSLLAQFRARVVRLDDTNNADPNRPFAVQAVLAFVGSREVLIYNVDTNPDEPTCNQVRPYNPSPQVTLPADYTLLNGHLHMADIDGDGDTDILVPVARVGSTQPELAAIINRSRDPDGAPGLLDASAVLIPALADNVAKEPLLATGDLNGDARADYVFADTVALAEAPDADGIPQSLNTVIRQPNAPWARAVITDVNGDDSRDIVALRNDVRSVDWLLNADDSGRFNGFQIDVPARPTLLRDGDFDGDLVSDIAFIGDSDNAKERQRLYVIYGTTSGGPGDAIDMGPLSQRVDMMEATNTPNTLDGSANGIDDLSILAVDSLSGEGVPPVDETSDLSELEINIFQLAGSTARQFLSLLILPFSPDDDGNGEEEDEEEEDELELSVLRTGQFLPPTDMGMEGNTTYSNIATIAEFEPAQDGEEKRAQHRLFSIGQREDDSQAVSAAVDLGPLSEFQATCAIWLVDDLDTDSDATSSCCDELIGVETSLTCDDDDDETAATDRALGLRILRTTSANGKTQITDAGEAVTRIDLPSEIVSVERAQLVDLDGDGGLDLLLLVSKSGGEQGESTADVAIMWNDAGCAPDWFCADETKYLFPDSDFAISLPIGIPDGNVDDAIPDIIDIAPIRLQPYKSRSIVVLFRGSGVLAMSSVGPSIRQYLPDFSITGGELDLLKLSNDANRIVSGDFNGDGLDDLAYGGQGIGSVYLQSPAPSLGNDTSQDTDLGIAIGDDS